jgi:hypothetical protein
VVLSSVFFSCCELHAIAATVTIIIKENKKNLTLPPQDFVLLDKDKG